MCWLSQLSSVHLRQRRGLLDCASAGDGGELLDMLVCNLVLRLSQMSPWSKGLSRVSD